MDDRFSFHVAGESRADKRITFKLREEADGSVSLLRLNSPLGRRVVMQFTPGEEIVVHTIPCNIGIPVDAGGHPAIRFVYD